MHSHTATLDNLSSALMSNFQKMVIDSQWLSNEAKHKALRKANASSRVFGVRPEETLARDFKALFALAGARPSFAQTLFGMLRNNHMAALRTLFTGTVESAMRTVPMRPREARGVRDNRLVVNPVVVLPPFLPKEMSEVDVYAYFGFVIGRELTRAAGRFFKIWGVDIGCFSELFLFWLNGNDSLLTICLG